jgi:hypothetical protein
MKGGGVFFFALLFAFWIKYKKCEENSGEHGK